MKDEKKETMRVLGKQIAQHLNRAFTPSPKLSTDEQFEYLGTYVAASIIELGWSIVAPDFRIAAAEGGGVHLRLIRGGADSAPLPTADEIARRGGNAE